MLCHIRQLKQNYLANLLMLQIGLMLEENLYQSMKSYIHGGHIGIEIGKNQIEEEG